MDAYKQDIGCLWLERCWEIGFGKIQSFLGSFQDVVFELELFSQIWQVLLVEIKGICESSNVKKSALEKLVRVLAKPIVEDNPVCW